MSKNSKKFIGLIFQVIVVLFPISIFFVSIFGDGSINSEIEYTVSECPSANDLEECMNNFWWFLAWKFGVAIGMVSSVMFVYWITVKFGLRLFFKGVLPVIVKCLNRFLPDPPKEDDPKPSVKT